MRRDIWRSRRYLRHRVPQKIGQWTRELSKIINILDGRHTIEKAIACRCTTWQVKYGVCTCQKAHTDRELGSCARCCRLKTIRKNNLTRNKQYRISSSFLHQNQTNQTQYKRVAHSGHGHTHTTCKNTRHSLTAFKDKKLLARYLCRYNH